MQYSPTLKIAMEEIKEVLKKHDIAGFVVLHTPGFSEYLNHLSTTYSCASIVNGELRLKLKTTEVGKEKAKQLADDTYNMFTHLADLVGQHAMMYIDTKMMLQKKWNGYDESGNHSSHTEQNN